MSRLSAVPAETSLQIRIQQRIVCLLQALKLHKWDKNNP